MTIEPVHDGRGWHWLRLFWVAVLLTFGGGAFTLHSLGPPPIELAEAPSEPVAQAEAPAPIPALPLLSGVPEPLRRHVHTALTEPSVHGPLPRIGADGRSPMRAYARSFDRDDPRPRVALILGGLGLNQGLSEQAIRTLPPSVALAFNPYAVNPVALLEQARTRGFETLLALPMEPTGFPLNDPGERALLTGLPAGELAGRLEWLLARFPGHIGAVGALGAMRGERFAALTEPFGQMQLALAARGLLYFDVRPGVPSAQRAWGRTVDVLVDVPPARAEIDLRLSQIERMARERGGALGYVGELTPVALQRITAWADGLDSRGVVLAPVTAVMRRPDGAAINGRPDGAAVDGRRDGSAAATVSAR